MFSALPFTCVEFPDMCPQLLVVGPGDDVALLKEEVMSDMADIFSSVDKGGACCNMSCQHGFCWPCWLMWWRRLAQPTDTLGTCCLDGGGAMCKPMQFFGDSGYRTAPGWMHHQTC